MLSLYARPVNHLLLQVRMVMYLLSLVRVGGMLLRMCKSDSCLTRALMIQGSEKHQNSNEIAIAISKIFMSPA
ncbi:hypothetical protein ES705_17292 [subsurface metagenome]